MPSVHGGTRRVRRALASGGARTDELVGADGATAWGAAHGAIPGDAARAE